MEVSAKHRILMVAGKAVNVDYIMSWEVVKDPVTDWAVEDPVTNWAIKIVFQNKESIILVDCLESKDLALKLSECIFGEIDEECDTLITMSELDNILYQLRRNVPTDKVTTEVPEERTVCFNEKSFLYADLVDIGLVYGIQLLGKPTYNVVGTLKNGDSIIFCERLKQKDRAEKFAEFITNWYKTNDVLTSAILEM